MATEAELNSRLDALKKALHTGVLTVQHGDVRTTFRTYDELKSVIASLEAEIASKSTGQRRRIRYAYQPRKAL